MSAAPVILPLVWALAEAAAQPNQPPIQAFAARKAPHRLQLVHAAAQPSRPRTVRSLPDPHLAFYRKYTEAMLQRSMKLSFESGRTPSMLGREIFRGNVTHCRVDAFDDVVIFVHDIGRVVEQLSPGQQLLIRRIAMQEYSQGETAAMLGMNLRTVIRRYYEALDRLTGLLLERKLLQPMLVAAESRPHAKSCQGVRVAHEDLTPTASIA